MWYASGMGKQNAETESRAEKVILSYLETLYARTSITDKWWKAGLFHKQCWGNRLSIWRENESLPHTIFLKTNAKDLNVKCKSLKCVDENTREYFYDLWVVKDFLKQRPKTLTLNKSNG